MHFYDGPSSAAPASFTWELASKQVSQARNSCGPLHPRSKNKRSLLRVYVMLLFQVAPSISVTESDAFSLDKACFKSGHI